MRVKICHDVMLGICGVYRTGQLISAGGMLTMNTAYNHNTNDVVGLYIIESPSPGQLQIMQQLQPALDKRRQIRSSRCHSCL